jgi:hypothetical protein
MCMLLNIAIRLPNPGLLQDAAGNKDEHGGAGGASNRRRTFNRVCLLLVTQ